MIKSLLALLNNAKGQALVDYGLIISLVILVVIVSLIAVSGGIQDLFEIIIGEFPVAN